MKPRLRRILRGARRAGIRGVASALCAVLFATTPAAADTGLGGLGFGVPAAGSLGVTKLPGTMFMAAGHGTGMPLIGTTYPLSSLNPVTGAVTGMRVTSALGTGYATGALLAGTGTSQFMAVNLADMRQRAAQTARRQMAAQQSARKEKQASVEGCPTSAPGNTLRDGSASIGVYQLCVDSVKLARTPAAASAIKWALNHLGIPYSQQYRMTGNYYDCSSFVSSAYHYGAGLDVFVNNWAPTTSSIRGLDWAVKIPFKDVRPGDLVEPISGHIVMALADGYKVHTNMPGDVSKVEKEYTSAYWSAWVDPSRVD